MNYRLLFLLLIIIPYPLSAEGGQNAMPLAETDPQVSFCIDLTRDNAPAFFDVGIEVETNEEVEANSVILELQSGKAVNKHNFNVWWEGWTAKGILLSASISPLEYRGDNSSQQYNPISWSLSGKDTDDDLLEGESNIELNSEDVASAEFFRKSVSLFQKIEGKQKLTIETENLVGRPRGFYEGSITIEIKPME